MHPFPAYPIRIIRTHGDDYTIGRQHCEFLGDSVRNGMISFYFDFWKRSFSATPKRLIERYAVNMAKYFIDPVMISRLIRNVPDFAKERVRAISDFTGYSFEDMCLTLVLPDLFPMLQAYYARWVPRRFVSASYPRFACSSFVSRGQHFFYGRNLDFPGVAYWDRYPVIQLTEPHNSLRYIAFTSAGIPLGGITGINEAQISVALHQHYCTRTNLRGKLPIAIGEEILMKARSVDDALTILKQNRVAASWAFMICDGKTRQAVFCEAHPDALGIRTLANSPGYLTHTNFFQTPECQPAEYATTERMNWDNYSRNSRLKHLLAQAGHGLDACQAVQFLSEHIDPFWAEEKIINRTVSQLYNIQSVLIDVEQMVAWIAEGNSPIHLRQYRKIDLGRVFAGDLSLASGAETEILEGYVFQDRAKQKAKELYVEAFVFGFDGDYKKSLERVEDSLKSDFCPEAAQVAAILLLKVAEDKKACELLERAKEVLEQKIKTKGIDQYPPEYFEILMWLARSYDLLGLRDLAQKTYRQILYHPNLKDTNLREYARKATIYRRDLLERNLMPFSSYIPFE